MRSHLAQRLPRESSPSMIVPSVPGWVPDFLCGTDVGLDGEVRLPVVQFDDGHPLPVISGALRG